MCFKNIVMTNMFCYDILCAGVAWVEWTMMNMLRYVEDFIAITLSWKFDGIQPKNAIQHSQEKAYPARRTSICFFSNWVDFLMDKCVEICGFLSCRVRKHALLVIYPIFGIPHKIGRYIYTQYSWHYIFIHIPYHSITSQQIYSYCLGWSLHMWLKPSQIPLVFALLVDVQLAQVNKLKPGSKITLMGTPEASPIKRRRTSKNNPQAQL